METDIEFIEDRISDLWTWLNVRRSYSHDGGKEYLLCPRPFRIIVSAEDSVNKHFCVSCIYFS